MVKPTKSILCHRSNSGSSPRRPLAATLPLSSLSLSLPYSRVPLLLQRRSVRGMPPFVPPPSRSPAQTSLRLLPQRVRLCRGWISPPSHPPSPRTSNYGSRDVHDQPRGNKPLSTGCLSRYSAAFHGGLGLPASTTDRPCPASMV